MFNSTLMTSMKSNDSSIPQVTLEALSEKSRQCIQSLIAFLMMLEIPDLPAKLELRTAAVLVLLYEGNGELRVLLTTRSKELRTHAGQTALPGGKKDSSDPDLTFTALREANEEVGLPLSSPFIHVIGSLHPFISLHKILVTPVIAFLSNSDVLQTLTPAEGEVSHIFTHPLEAILDPSLARREALVPIGSENWPYESELYNTSDSIVSMLGNTTYRMHRFRSSASAIKGLTADILIKVAEIAYAMPTRYERYAPGQLKDIVDIVTAAMRHSQATAA